MPKKRKTEEEEIPLEITSMEIRDADGNVEKHASSVVRRKCSYIYGDYLPGNKACDSKPCPARSLCAVNAINAGRIALPSDAIEAMNAEAETKFGNEYERMRILGMLQKPEKNTSEDSVPEVVEKSKTIYSEDVIEDIVAARVKEALIAKKMKKKEKKLLEIKKIKLKEREKRKKIKEEIRKKEEEKTKAAKKKIKEAIKKKEEKRRLKIEKRKVTHGPYSLRVDVASLAEDDAPEKPRKKKLLVASSSDE